MTLPAFMYELAQADLSAEPVVLVNQELVRQRVREERLRASGLYGGAAGGLLFSERAREKS